MVQRQMKKNNVMVETVGTQPIDFDMSCVIRGYDLRFFFATNEHE
jgi:hypothetical protein